MSTEKIRTIIENLPVQQSGGISSFLGDAGPLILSQREALTSGNLLIRERMGLVSVANKGFQPAMLLAGEPLIGQWQTRETLLALPNLVLFIPLEFLSEASHMNYTIKNPTWQEGSIGLLSLNTLEILPTPSFAAQLWPILLAKQDPPGKWGGAPRSIGHPPDRAMSCSWRGRGLYPFRH